MAVLRNTDLIKKGVETLEDARRNTDTGDFETAKIEVQIAAGYARLAEALGEKGVAVHVNSFGGWS